MSTNVVFHTGEYSSTPPNALAILRGHFEAGERHGIGKEVGRGKGRKETGENKRQLSLLP